MPAEPITDPVVLRTIAAILKRERQRLLREEAARTNEKGRPESDGPSLSKP